MTDHSYPGDEVQSPDPFIFAKMGMANTPAYRCTAYVVFEELNLSAFGTFRVELPATISMDNPIVWGSA